ncbi:MAG: glutaredoxin [Spirochaetes bacterium]|nr:MAG: glutaredoxin [Spirochaetota bacterium]
MGFINEKDKKVLSERLSKLEKPVKLIYFTQEMECQFCKETHSLMEETAELSDKITLEVKHFLHDKELADSYKVDKIPAIMVLGENDKDFGIRFFGIPAGYEFMSLLESMEMVAKEDSGLSPASRETLKKLKDPLNLQVFVTPTCPYCPKAVVLAFRFAMESELVTSAMIEATEFPALSNRYNVSGVPHTVIGDSMQPMVGAYPENAAMEMIAAAIGLEG